jgi:hypothetical protein
MARGTTLVGPALAGAHSIRTEGNPCLRVT